MIPVFFRDKLRKGGLYLLFIYNSTSIVFFLLLYIISDIASHWIDSLYKKQPQTLSYPASREQRAYYRKGFLFIASCALLLFFPSYSVSVFMYQLVLAYFLLLVICTDFEQYVIFDKMLLPFGIIAFPMIFFMELPLLDHLASAFAGGGLFLLLAILTRGGIGGGDIKLIFVLGLWLGSRLLMGTVILGFCLGGLAALFLLLTKQKKRKEFFAYGPYFSAAAIFLSLKSLS